MIGLIQELSCNYIISLFSVSIINQQRNAIVRALSRAILLCIKIFVVLEHPLLLQTFHIIY